MLCLISVSNLCVFFLSRHRIRLGTMKLLLDRGADPNAARVPMPVLFLAIMAADTENVRKLLLCGARTDIPLPPEAGAHILNKFYVQEQKGEKKAPALNSPENLLLCIEERPVSTACSCSTAGFSRSQNHAVAAARHHRPRRTGVRPGRDLRTRQGVWVLESWVLELNVFVLVNQISFLFLYLYML